MSRLTPLVGTTFLHDISAGNSQTLVTAGNNLRGVIVHWHAAVCTGFVSVGVHAELRIGTSRVAMIGADATGQGGLVCRDVFIPAGLAVVVATDGNGNMQHTGIYEVL